MAGGKPKRRRRGKGRRRNKLNPRAEKGGTRTYAHTHTHTPPSFSVRKDNHHDEEAGQARFDNHQKRGNGVLTEVTWLLSDMGDGRITGQEQYRERAAGKARQSQKAKSLNKPGETGETGRSQVRCFRDEGDRPTSQRRRLISRTQRSLLGLLPGQNDKIDWGVAAVYERGAIYVQVDLPKVGIVICARCKVLST
jgi:hypothetical protein